MKTYYLITNISGMKYWSCRSRSTKHGIIYVNRKGGYFTAGCVRTIHETIKSNKFPAE